MKKKNVRTAVIYTRVATKILPTPLHALSEQTKQCEAYCKVKGLKVIAHYDEIRSGMTKNLEKTQLAMAIQKCLETNSVLVVTKLDRITRNFSKIVDFLKNLKAINLSIAKASSSPEESLVQELHQSIADQERKMISEKIKAGLQRRKENLNRTKGTFTSYVKGRRGVYEVTSTLPKMGKVINSKRL
jgi:DNA invertase Pin-like site-specific DNA recombinase